MGGGRKKGRTVKDGVAPVERKLVLEFLLPLCPIRVLTHQQTINTSAASSRSLCSN